MAEAKRAGDAPWEDMVVVGRVTRTHGLRGHVMVAPDTDFVDERFAPGSTLWRQEAGEPVAFVVTSARVQGGRPVLALEGVGSIDDAAALVGKELRVPADQLQPLPPGTHYQHELVGCIVETAAGQRVGTVVRVDGGAAGSLLAVEGVNGEVLIPFAAAICVEIDVEGRRIQVAPPEGLLELNETGGTSRTRRARRRRSPVT